MDGTEGDTMTSLIVLLCLGLSEGTETPAKAGTLPKPTLWAEPGSVVPQGSLVTFWCQGASGAQEFFLDKLKNSSWYVYLRPEPGDKVKYSVPLMAKENAGTYRCYYLSSTGWSESSDPLELMITGLYWKPSLSALPSPVVALGENVTLQCGSDQGFDWFVLTQEGDTETTRKLDSQRVPHGQRQALYHVGPITPGQRWLFRCYGHFSNTTTVWSHPSNLVQLLVSGQLTYAPALSVKPGPSVSPGENVTLLCRSGGWRDTFLLAKEGASELLLYVKVNKIEEITQGQFSFHSVTSAHGGTYRCYSLHNNTPYWLSNSRVPLQLGVSGPPGNSTTMSTAGEATQDYTVGNLIRLGIAGFILLILGILLLEAWLSQRRHRNRPAAGVQGTVQTHVEGPGTLF